MDMFDEYRIKHGSTRLSVPPEKLFEDWAFIIEKPQWGIFGLEYKSWLDIDKNAPLRAARTLELVGQGIHEKEAKLQATKEIKHKIYGWGVNKEIDQYDSFYVGYVFRHKTKPISLQIVDIDSDYLLIVEFNTESKRYTGFYSASANELVNALMTGSYELFAEETPMRMKECDLKYLINNHLNGLSNHARQAILI
jgi:hypothetical protein